MIACPLTLKPCSCSCAALSNVRSVQKEDKQKLTSIKQFSLEEAIAYIRGASCLTQRSVLSLILSCLQTMTSSR